LPHKSPEARKAYLAKWCEKNRAKTREASRRFRARHLERSRTASRVAVLRRYHEVLKHDPAYVERKRVAARAWYYANRERAFINVKASVTKRRKLEREATPRWANKEAIRAMYREAVSRSLETGIPHEVDHIVPLRGKGVRGLHVEFNLRVVTKAANRAKGAAHLS